MLLEKKCEMPFSRGDGFVGCAGGIVGGRGFQFRSGLVSFIEDAREGLSEAFLSTVKEEKILKDHDECLTEETWQLCVVKFFKMIKDGKNAERNNVPVTFVEDYHLHSSGMIISLYAASNGSELIAAPDKAGVITRTNI